MLPVAVNRGPANPLKSLVSRFPSRFPVAVRRGSRKWLKCLPSRFRLGVASQTPHTPLGLAPSLEGEAPPCLAGKED